MTPSQPPSQTLRAQWSQAVQDYSNGYGNVGTLLKYGADMAAALAAQEASQSSLSGLCSGAELGPSVPNGEDSGHLTIEQKLAACEEALAKVFDLQTTQQPLIEFYSDPVKFSRDMALRLVIDRDEKKHENRLLRERIAAQASPQVCGVVGEPESGWKVCELPPGHEGYHQQGSVRWLGYHPKSVAEASPQPKIARGLWYPQWHCLGCDRYHDATVIMCGCGDHAPAAYLAACRQEQP